MDSRLELTDKQKSLVEQFSELINEMHNEGIGFVGNMNGMMINGLMFYNTKEVITSESNVDCFSGYVEHEEGYAEESFNGEEAEDGQIWYTPSPEDLEYVSIDVDQYNDDDMWFSVLLEKNEEMGIFKKKHEKAQKLAPLMEERNKLEKRIKRHVDGLTDAEDDLHRLEGKGLPQEIIDEEKAKVETTRKELEKLNGELKELDAKIRKVKAIKVK
jgi:hypothetical protein